MNKTKEDIETILATSSFAVLATEANGQPHTSLIAITPFENYRQLIFATLRKTIKFQNLSHNNKVAVLVENRRVKMTDLKESTVLTIIGHTEEIPVAKNKAAYQAHLNRHPEMGYFLSSPDCILLMVTAQSFQIVNGIDDVRWITAAELDYPG